MPGNDPFKGHDSQIVVETESTQGTTVTPTRHLGKIVEETSHPDPTVNWYEERLIGGDRELSGKSEGQRVYDGGDYPILPYDGYPIALLLGSYDSFTTDSPSTGTDTHVLGPKMDGKPPTFTAEATLYGRGGGSDFVRTFGGVAAMSGEISVDNDSRLQTTLETEGLNVTTGSSPTNISIPDRDPWIFSDISSNFSFAGTTFARLEDFTLSIDNGSEPRFYIQTTTGNDPYEILYGNIAYDLSATITVDDDTLYQELVSSTAGGVAVNIEFTKPSGDKLVLDASAANLEESPYDTPRGDDEAVSVEASMIPESVTVTVEDTGSGGSRYTGF